MFDETKLKNFELLIHRRYLARIIARYELFNKISNVEGSIIECGVHNGGGVMASILGQCQECVMMLHQVNQLQQPS
jgi:hypothetical protein